MLIQLWVLFKSFFLIGSVSFGGYMALVAMVKKRFVDEKKIISDEVLLEGISLSSFLPGPVAVNVVAYVGYKVEGVAGALVSIFAVLLPSFILVTICAVWYFNFGNSILFDGIMIGIIPAVVAIICTVGFGMIKKVCNNNYQYGLVFLCSIALFFFSGYLAIVMILLLSGFLGFVFGYEKSFTAPSTQRRFSKSLLILGIIIILIAVLAKFIFTESLLLRIFTEFSSVSLTLFGGGYVMVPILQSILVDHLGWLSYEEFAFGISIGQVTPGPILISAAFFGFKVSGILGAIVATIAIFLPSCLLMILASEFYQKISHNRILRSALLGIKPAVVGLILFSGISIFMTHAENNDLAFSIILCVGSILALTKLNFHPAAVIVISGFFGVVYNNII